MKPPILMFPLDCQQASDSVSKKKLVNLNYKTKITTPNDKISDNRG